jgi:uncharacterized protein YbjT (DUF2867 family)
MILVAGATGAVGGQVARRLLDKGAAVRVLARRGSPYEALRAAGAEPVIGDLKDPTSLAEACRGVDAVVTTANSAGRGGEDTAETVDLQGNRNLIDAARKADVGRFVFTSVLVPDILRSQPFLQAKLATEDYLRRSGLEYTILRPTMFMDAWIAMAVLMPLEAGEPVTVAGDGRRKHSFVAAGDVAEFLVAAVDHPAAENASINVGGPEALSWSEVVHRCEGILGRRLPVRHVRPGESVPGLPAEVAAMLASTDDYDSVVDMTKVASTFGMKLTTVDEFLRRALSGPS